MEHLAPFITAVAQILWPILFVTVVFYLRHEIRSLIQPGTEFVFEVLGGKVSLTPTRVANDNAELPAVPEDERLPPDYLYVNHTSFLRDNKQSEFQQRTGVFGVPHYDIQVIVDSYYRGALDRIVRVEYVLNEAYPEPFQIRTRKADKFLLKEVANGEYVLLAKVFLLGRTQPLILQRYITLWKSGPPIGIKVKQYVDGLSSH